MPLDVSSVVFLMTQSMARLNRIADMLHPCITPVFTSKGSGTVSNNALEVMVEALDDFHYLARDSIRS